MASFIAKAVVAPGGGAGRPGHLLRRRRRVSPTRATPGARTSTSRTCPPRTHSASTSTTCGPAESSRAARRRRTARASRSPATRWPSSSRTGSGCSSTAARSSRPSRRRTPRRPSTPARTSRSRRPAPRPRSRSPVRPATTALPNPPATLTHQWTQVSGPTPVTFNDATALSTTAHFPQAALYVLRLSASDGLLSSSDDVTINVNPTGGVPADPGTVAPPLDPSVAIGRRRLDGVPLHRRRSDPDRRRRRHDRPAAGRRSCAGSVLTRDGAPLSGVKITILQHPELGQTLSRADGMFDMAVNGGGVLTFRYEKAGVLPAQRQIGGALGRLRLPAGRLARARGLAGHPDRPHVARRRSRSLAAIPSPTPTARARRRCSFPPGRRPGSCSRTAARVPTTQLHVRLTEYTVGPSGPSAMPGELPPTSSYTYATELGADEAVAKVNGRDVVFNHPVLLYLENFTGIPVGQSVPAGYYDPARSAWVGAPDGRVIKVLGKTAGPRRSRRERRRCRGHRSGPHGARHHRRRAAAAREPVRRRDEPLAHADRPLLDDRHELPRGLRGRLRDPQRAAARRRPTPVRTSRERLDHRLRPPDARRGRADRRDAVLAPLRERPRSGPDRRAETAARSLDQGLASGRPGNAARGSRGRAEARAGLSRRTRRARPSHGTATTPMDGRSVGSTRADGARRLHVQARSRHPGRRRDLLGPVFGNPDVRRLRARRASRSGRNTRPRSRAGTAARSGLGGWTLSALHAYDPVGRVVHFGDGTRRDASTLSAGPIPAASHQHVRRQDSRRLRRRRRAGDRRALPESLRPRGRPGRQRVHRGFRKPSDPPRRNRTGTSRPSRATGPRASPETTARRRRPSSTLLSASPSAPTAASSSWIRTTTGFVRCGPTGRSSPIAGNGSVRPSAATAARRRRRECCRGAWRSDRTAPFTSPTARTRASGWWIRTASSARSPATVSLFPSATAFRRRRSTSACRRTSRSAPTAASTSSSAVPDASGR